MTKPSPSNSQNKAIPADDPAIWDKNLAAIVRHHPELAQRLITTTPTPLTWVTAKSGDLSAHATSEAGRPLWIGSRYDPKAETQKLIADLDYVSTACVVALGVGLGYHIPTVAKAIGTNGVILVYEPDLAQFKAVLQRIDHSSWLGMPNMIIADQETDKGALTAKFDPHAAHATQGTQLITHPATRQRHAEAIQEFSQTVADLLAYCRTNIATALVNSARTVRNLVNNLPVYTAGATIAELHQWAKRDGHSYPAVCVGAGPSLVKNVDLLRDPAIRNSVIVITVQTALKPLLDRGIEPDFVTALDYSPICKRFYENLPDLPRTTLIIEPKCNAVIPQSYPGPVRTARADVNDQIIAGAGDDLLRAIPPMRGGATVAHLSFYFARYLGCDPIMFIGQDLGFSDGLYYAPGTAVHDVWSSEINEFNSIEMMEWQRIVRHKGNLSRHTDIHGRPIFSDEQMVTYLRQFERDFHEATQDGATILDCTEGGMAKEGTTAMSFKNALRLHANKAVPDLPLPSLALDSKRLDRLDDLLDLRFKEINTLRQLTTDTVALLNRMLKHQRDKSKMDKLFKQLNRNQARIDGELKQAFFLVNQLNTVGAFRRSRADRSVNYESKDIYDKQRRQLERDLENLDWLGQCCVEAIEIVQDALRATKEAKQANREQVIQPSPQIVTTTFDSLKTTEQPISRSA